MARNTAGVNCRGLFWGKWHLTVMLCWTSKPGNLVATYQVICHIFKSVRRVQTKGLVTPVTPDTDAGLPLIIWQVLIVPVEVKYRVEHKSEKGVQGKAMEWEAIWFPLMSYAVNRKNKQKYHLFTRSHATCEIPEKKNLKLMALTSVLSRVREKSGKEACRGLKNLDNGGKPQFHCYICGCNVQQNQGQK